MRASSLLTRLLSQCSPSELVFSLPRHCTFGWNWVLVGDYRYSIWGSIFNVLHFYLFDYVTSEQLSKFIFSNFFKNTGIL